MATSGSTDFSINRDDIITFALKKLGRIAEGDTPNTDQVLDAAFELNMMVKHWQAPGLNLWAVKKGFLFLEKDTSEYNLGATGDHATTAYLKTEMRVAAIAAATTLEVDSTTGMTALDNIGVIQDDGTSHWTTIASITDSDTLVLTTGLVSAAAIDKEIYTYTTKIDRPLKITGMWRRDDFGADIPINMITRQTYDELTNKTADNKAVQAYYDPQLTNGILSVWSEPTDLTDILVFRYQRPFDDFDASSDTPDFPQEWYLSLGYGLAALLCDTYGVSETIARKIEGKAAFFKAEAMEFDAEEGSIFLTPEGDWRGA